MVSSVFLLSKIIFECDCRLSWATSLIEHLFPWSQKLQTVTPSWKLSPRRLVVSATSLTPHVCILTSRRRPPSATPRKLRQRREKKSFADGFRQWFIPRAVCWWTWTRCSWPNWANAITILVDISLSMAPKKYKTFFWLQYSFLKWRKMPSRLW